VEKWLCWEESFGFVKKGHNRVALGGTRVRPAAIQWWIAQGHMGDPDIGDLGLFKEQWWNWWKLVNPDWQEATDNGKLMSTGDGPWDALKISGINGLFSPLICLCWWFQWICHEGENLAWLSTVANMTWVLNCLLRM
ncbi:hypothetical protein C8J56DRAFT_801032, partial [Mycena floridula]